MSYISVGAIKKMRMGAVFKDNSDAINSMDFSADGEHLITSGDDQQLVLYDCCKGTKVKALPSKKYGADLVRFTHEKNSVIYASKSEWDHGIRQLDVKSFQYARAFKGHRKPVVSMVMNPADHGFASASLDGTVRFWDMRSNLSKGLIRSEGRPVVAYDSAGAVFAGGFNNNTIKLFDVRCYEKGPFTTFLVKRPSGVVTEWTDLKFSPCGNYLLASALDGAIFLVDAFYGTMMASYAGHLNTKNIAMGTSFSPDSKFVLAGSEDGSIYVWRTPDIPEGDKKPPQPNTSPCIQARLTGHGAPVTCVQWNPKKMMLASACNSLAFWVPTEATDR